MLSHLRATNFSNHFLRFVDQDPVHSLTEQRNLERRCRYDRNIFFLIENDVPVAVLCVAFTNGLPDDIGDILDVDSQISLLANHAIFYSVFRTDKPCTIQNAGAKLIREAAQWIKGNMPQITNFVTMSPIPNLSAHFPEPPSMEAIMEFLQAQRDPVAKFHIRNGARVLRTIPNADTSEKRKAQSFGHMVNYSYTEALTGDSINN
jgi:malonyl-CoA decarboxylase